VDIGFGATEWSPVRSVRIRPLCVRSWTALTSWGSRAVTPFMPCATS